VVDHGVVQSRDPEHLAAALKLYCRSSSIEQPTPDRIDRIVRAAYQRRLSATSATATFTGF
jgi:hypothetical protein